MSSQSPNITRTKVHQGVEYGYEESTGRFYQRVNGRWVPSTPPSTQGRRRDVEDDEDDDDDDDDSSSSSDEEDDDDDDDDEEDDTNAQRNALAARLKSLSIRRAETDPGAALNSSPPDIRTGFDPRTQVRSWQQYSPQAQITPAVLANMGVEAYAAIKWPGNRETEPSDPSYKKRDRPSRFFAVGKVFQILWAEPTNAVTTVTVPIGYTPGIHGQPTFQRYRRFIVVIEGQEGQGSCVAVPILTHNRQGTAAPGVRKSIYGIVFSGQKAPQPTRAETPRQGEEGMQPNPIRINMDKNTESLDPLSRICYGKLYTIEHNLPVKSVGMVHDQSRAPFFAQVKACLTSRIGVARNQRGSTSSQANAGPSSSGPGPQGSYPLTNVPTAPSQATQSQAGGKPRYTRDTLIANHDNIVRGLIRTGMTAEQAEARFQAMLAAASNE